MGGHKLASIAEVVAEHLTSLAFATSDVSRVTTLQRKKGKIEAVGIEKE